MSVRVVCLQSETLAASALDRKQHAIVGAGPVGAVVTEIAVVRSLYWILQRQQPALKRIGRRRARAIGPAGEHATRAWQVDDRVDLVAIRDVNDIAADIVRCHQPVRTDLPLDAETPLVCVWWLHVLWSPVVLR